MGRSQGDESASPGPATVVLVDDEPDVLLILERLLERAGFDIVGTARDGQAGIDLVAEQQPDAVLLDLAMPRIDGEASLPELLRRAPRTMVAILSAHVDEALSERLFRRGAFAAYVKGDLGGLPAVLAEDLASFRRVLDGEDDVPAWQRRFRRL